MPRPTRAFEKAKRTLIEIIGHYFVGRNIIVHLNPALGQNRLQMVAPLGYPNRSMSEIFHQHMRGPQITGGATLPPQATRGAGGYIWLMMSDL